MKRPLDKVTISAFKSIRALREFELRPLNVLIGANGVGKSNFVSFFALLRQMMSGALQLAVAKAGGADRHLFLGPSVSSEISATLHFGPNTYAFALQPTADNRFVFSSESATYHDSTRLMGRGHFESRLPSQRNNRGAWGFRGIESHVFEAISSWTLYHFHNTSENSGVRRQETIRDYEILRSSAENLAAFLFRLRSPEGGIRRRGFQESYDAIRESIRLIAPYFDDFRLEPEKSNGDEVIQLEWRQRGSDYPFHASQLSDGTLRFACLATALLQPNPPATLIFDEPELGLHPYALTVLAGLIKQAATRTQVIISTQSAALLDYFEPEDVVVVDRRGGASEFRRLDADQLKSWLSDYTLGELWRKNAFDGGPAHE